MGPVVRPKLCKYVRNMALDGLLRYGKLTGDLLVCVPGCDQPGWMEFFYQAFVIGCTFASSDVNVTSMRMRRIVVIQGVADFFFNAIILALTINVAANLF